MNKIFTLLLLLSVTGTVLAKKNKAPAEPLEKPLTSTFVDVIPTFDKQDLRAFRQWVVNNIDYPQSAVEKGFSGQVTVRFIVEVDRSISSIEILESPSKAISNEVIRTMKRAPKFSSPALKDKKAVRYSTDMPIVFRLKAKDGSVKETKSANSAVVKCMPIYNINELPRYHDGRPILEYIDWIVENIDHPLKDPTSKAKGNLTFYMIHEIDGSVTLEVSKSPDPSLTKELERVVKMSPELRPAMKDGEPVRFKNIASIPLWKLRTWSKSSFSAAEKKFMATGKPSYLDDVDILPTYDGKTIVESYKAIMALAAKNLPESEKSQKGSVKISFTLAKDCSISDIVIVDSPGESFSEAAIKAVEGLPNKWTVAELYGEKVNVKMNVLVPFRGTSSSNALIVADEMPTFKGGNIMKFREWVMSQIKYPEEAAKQDIQGQVVIAFYVEEDGSVEETQIIRSPNTSLSNEVERVVMNSPQWEPGKNDGKPVRIKYTLPVVFKKP